MKNQDFHWQILLSENTAIKHRKQELISFQDLTVQ